MESLLSAGPCVGEELEVESDEDENQVEQLCEQVRDSMCNQSELVCDLFGILLCFSTSYVCEPFDTQM